MSRSILTQPYSTFNISITPQDKSNKKVKRRVQRSGLNAETARAGADGQWPARDPIPSHGYMTHAETHPPAAGATQASRAPREACCPDYPSTPATGSLGLRPGEGGPLHDRRGPGSATRQGRSPTTRPSHPARTYHPHVPVAPPHGACPAGRMSPSPSVSRAAAVGRRAGVNGGRGRLCVYDVGAWPGACAAGRMPVWRAT